MKNPAVTKKARYALEQIDANSATSDNSMSANPHQIGANPTPGSKISTRSRAHTHPVLLKDAAGYQTLNRAVLFTKLLYGRFVVWEASTFHPLDEDG